MTTEEKAIYREENGRAMAKLARRLLREIQEYRDPLYMESPSVNAIADVLYQLNRMHDRITGER